MDNIILELNIAKDFSRCPGARYRHEGNHSGEEFREDHLLPKLKEAHEKGGKLKVILDGSAGYSTAFLEEAFGGLIRHDKMEYETILKTIIFVSDEDPSYEDDIRFYLQKADEYHKKHECK